jgi:putative endonuclease
VVRLFPQIKNGDVYVGSTDNLRRRYASHQAGQVISTRGNLPAALVAYVAVTGATSARRLERYFKTGSGKAFAKKRLLTK